MLFLGGVPTLLCYVAIVVWPAIRAEFEAAQKKAGSIKQKPLMRELP